MVWGPADKEDNDHNHGHSEGFVPGFGEAALSQSDDNEAITDQHDNKGQQETHH